MTLYWSSDDGRLRLFLGDCREVLPALGVQADLIVADPPYGETTLAWDRWPEGWLAIAAATAKSMWCWLPLRQFATKPFRGLEFADAGWRLSHDAEASWDHIVWDKEQASSFVADRFRRVHEPVHHWYHGSWAEVYHDTPREPHTGPASRHGHHGFGARTAHTGAIADRVWVDDGTRLMKSVISARRPIRGSIHRTEKPVEVLAPLISYGCPPGGLVIDPFAGSCSTLAAAHQLGARAVGIEANEQYAEAGARRLEALLSQPSLFAAGPEEVAG